MKTLVIIFGQVRTLESCILSIYDKILLANRPCQVILSIDGKYQDIPSSVLDLLSPFLLDIYVTHNRDDVLRNDQIIEFFLVQKAIERVDHDDFTFMIKIRTDIYLRHPIAIKTIYGQCSQQQFEKQFISFCNKAKLDWKDNTLDAIRSYILCASQDFFISKQLDKDCPPSSPWSTTNIYQWNETLFLKLSHILQIVHQKGLKITLAWIHNFIRTFYKENRILHLIGSTWIHFGYAKDVAMVSNILVEKHTTMIYPHHSDLDELQWIDHKNETRKMIQKEWKKITDDQIRMAHHLHNYPLIDLVNPHDYIESFDASNPHHVNKKRPELFAWIVRKHRI